MIQQSRRLLQMLLIATTVFFLVFYYATCGGATDTLVTIQKRVIIRPERIERKLIERSAGNETSMETEMPKEFEDFIDLSKCPPNQPISLFIKLSESPEYEKLFEAFMTSGYVTKKESGACITIAFGDSSSNAGSSTIVIGSESPNGIRVGPFSSDYRPGIDIIAYPNFDRKSAWIHPSPFLSKKKHRFCSITSGTETRADQNGNSTIQTFTLSDGLSKLRGCSFIFIGQSAEIEQSLRSILIVGSIPVLLESSRHAMPFAELVAPDDYAVFIRAVHRIYPLTRLTADRKFALRRNGRIFLDRCLREPKVVILTFKRLETLKLMVAIFQSIEDVLDKIIIVWNNVNAPLPEGTFLSKIELQFIRPRKNSLNNRFLPWHKIRTDCVLSVDDDVAVDKENLMLGFRTWQSEQDRIVSFAPRRREIDERGKPAYSFEKHERHEFGLTGYAFLHRNYLYEYFTSMPSAFRNYVDAHRNCEDIAMNYLVAHLSQRPVMTVAFGGSLDLVKNITGLSSRNNHQQVRTECVRFFEAAYGYNSLRSSYYQVAAHDILAKKHCLNLRALLSFQSSCLSPPSLLIRASRPAKERSMLALAVLLAIAALLPLSSSLCSPNGFEMTDLAYPKVCERTATINNGDGKVTVHPPKDAFYRREEFDERRMQPQSPKIHCLQKGAHLAIFGCTTHDCHESKTISHADLVDCGMDVVDYPYIAWWVVAAGVPVLVAAAAIVIAKRNVFGRIFKARSAYHDALDKAKRNEKLRKRINEEAEKRAAADAERARAEEAEKAANELPREDATQEGKTVA